MLALVTGAARLLDLETLRQLVDGHESLRAHYGQDRSCLMNWHVYIILCSDDSLYTGITTDIERRMRQHATGRGAKYFRGRQPKRLLYLESGYDRSTASKRELTIKGMKRGEKELLVAGATSNPHPHPVPPLEGEGTLGGLGVKSGAGPKFTAPGGGGDSSMQNA